MAYEENYNKRNVRQPTIDRQQEAPKPRRNLLRFPRRFELQASSRRHFAKAAAEDCG